MTGDAIYVASDKRAGLLYWNGTASACFITDR
jgi:hypothetical protein